MKKELIYTSQIYSLKMILKHCFSPDRAGHNFFLNDAFTRVNSRYTQGLFMNHFILQMARRIGLDEYSAMDELLPFTQRKIDF